MYTPHVAYSYEGYQGDNVGDELREHDNAGAGVLRSGRSAAVDARAGGWMLGYQSRSILFRKIKLLTLK